MTKRSGRLAVWRAGIRLRYRLWRKTALARRLARHSRSAAFGRRYLLFTIAILTVSTLLMSWLGALLQQSNADQLINAYMAEDAATFQAAAWPGQHTFLFKWPIFWLAGRFGYTTASFVVLTMLLAAATIGGLAYIMSRLERRPIVLGTMYLALSSMLLLVPAQPYAGGLLPVNMAMITTRNLEYILYIVSLYYLIKSRAFRSREFIIGVALLTLLLSSDRLFLSISIGGSLLALIVYALRERWEAVRLSVRWLMGSAAATALSAVIIKLLQQTGLTGIVAKSFAGPYGLVHDARGLLEGAWFAVNGLLTNFGANAAYDNLIIRELPQRLGQHLTSVGGLGYIVNFLLLAAAAATALGLMRHSLWPSKKMADEPLLPGVQLSLLLLWSGIAAVGLFVLTDHYYAVDARYLAISLFAVFIAAAAWTNRQKLHAETVLLAVPVLLMAVVSAGSGAVATQHIQKQALSDIDTRNQHINRTLADHRVDVLVGDYWRVVPVKAAGNHAQTILPLADCTQPRDALTSHAWEKDLKNHSFAYLLTLDKSLTDYPVCSLQQAVATYGNPDSTALVAGDLDRPRELLLFYEHGRRNQASLSAVKSESTPPSPLPISFADLPRPRCQGPTVMQVVAHQDDDLLFMNPDLAHSLRAGYCVRTIYLTAGDAGSDQRYWLSREQGSEAAYQALIGGKGLWTHRTVRLPGGQFAGVAEPASDSRVTLIYLHLPDGNVGGDGFPASRHQSLAKLADGRIRAIDSLNGLSHYSAASLTRALVDFMVFYQPTEIRTQSDYRSGQYQDHSDHHAAGSFAVRSRGAYIAHMTQHSRTSGVQVPSVQFYRGYNILELPGNVFGQDLADKQAVFLLYAAHDGGVCQTIESCHTEASYGGYLDREYTAPR